MASASFWDAMAEDYSSKIELYNLQGAMTTFLLARANVPGARLLEVGCGPGLGTEMVS